MSYFYKHYMESINKTSPIIIYIDMDGVLADLDLGQKDFIDKNLDNIFNNKLNLNTLSKKEKIRILKNIFHKKEDLVTPDERQEIKNSYWQNFIEQKYFEKLEVMSQVAALSKTLKEIKRKHPDVRIEILGSTGNPANHHEVAQQKINWLNKHKNKIDIVFHRHNFVAGRTLKQNYGAKNTILIDDTLSNCEEFKNAGGMAFHIDNNISELTNKLQKYVNRIKENEK